ncbi:MAG: universal stress protein [Candidatus Nitrosotenuis sp.]
MYFKNILVPYDGSDFSKKAFKIALDLAQKYESKISIVICIPKHYSSSWYVDNRISDLNFKKQYKAAKTESSKLESEAKKLDISLSSTILDTTNISKTLVDYAKSHKTDLIIIGSHGKSGWDKLVLGSVANGVLQRSECNVLLIK